MSLGINNIEGMFKNAEHGVYDNAENGNCSCCGECCSNHIIMSKKDVERIKKYIKRKRIKEHKRAVNFLAVNIRPSIDMTCPFLQDTNKKEKCAIYPVRPEICKEFLCSEWGKNKDTGYLMERYKKFTTGEYEPMNVRETFFGENNKMKL